ncbi:hypothetical protein AL073_03550 [Loktanella sp. 1ANDIMAR09]|nr:hypothetical protein AL073_03550 [Loktanella sp. 1ANDIMAR09]
MRTPDTMTTQRSVALRFFDERKTSFHFFSNTMSKICFQSRPRHKKSAMNGRYPLLMAKKTAYFLNENSAQTVSSAVSKLAERYEDIHKTSSQF